MCTHTYTHTKVIIIFSLASLLMMYVWQWENIVQTIFFSYTPYHVSNHHLSSAQNSDILIHEGRKGATKNDRCVIKINPLNSRDRWCSWEEWIPSSLQSWLSKERKSGEKRKGLRWSFRLGKEAKLLNWKHRRDRSQLSRTSRKNLYAIVAINLTIFDTGKLQLI